MTTPEPIHRGPTPAPLWAVLLITFLGSSGTAIVTSGIAFIAEQGLGYGPRMNLILALVMGAVYTPAAFLSGAVLRGLIRKSPAITSRGFLLALLIVEILVCQLPVLADALAPELTAPALWVTTLVFMVATGLQWPVVESYFSGGRRDKALRRAVGKFNICWSGAMVLSYWFMAPLLEHHPFVIVSLLGALHVLVAAIALVLPREPAKDLGTDPDGQGATPHPPVYEPLLRVFQILIVASYVVISTMIPLLPSIEGRLGIPVLWLTPIASTWLLVRVGVFALLERWHGWHGRWSAPWIGLGSMVLGFGITIASPLLEPVGIAALVAGLALVGVGIAIIYCGSLYYVLAVGGSEVDSGGAHEGLIGAGYTIGPLCGLLAGSVTGWREGASDGAVIVITSLVVGGISARAIRAARRSR